jgi:subtilisin family serine protease
VIAVGAVNSSGVIGNFSSYGPSSDGQIKPDVASIGVAAMVQASGGAIGTNNGTSFACPNMAGLATCLWQGFPELNNMKIRTALWMSSNKANAPDDRVGYGIPDMKKAVMLLLKDFTTSNANVLNCRAIINWTSKDINTMSYEIERMLPGQSSFTKIAEQPSAGTVFSKHSYQYIDPLDTLPQGIITYRIRQIIDTTGGISADYITTATVFHSVQCTSGLRPITIIPNPARDQFSLRITTPHPISNVVIRIFNIQGQLVKEIHKTKSANTITFDIPIISLIKGNYVVAVYDNNELISIEKLLKL